MSTPSEREDHAGLGGLAKREMPADDRALLRIGAISIVLGVLLGLGVIPFHGGTPPEDFQAVLPQIAANDYWVVVHFAQFVGGVLMLVGYVALYRSITQGASVGVSGALARMGIVVAVVAEGVYAINQAVDGIANKFVAQEWVSAASAEKADAFRVADAVRHIEIGTSSLWTLSVGIVLLFFGLAIALGRAYPRLLGWAAIAIGVGLFAYALNLAYNGFYSGTLLGIVGGLAGILQTLWILILAFFLWRKARGAGHRVRAQP